VAWPWALAALAGYLLGSIPVADLVSRRAGVDLREVGDRNPGYWNAREQLGGRRAIPVLLGDGAKGAAAGAVGLVLAQDGLWGVKWVAVGGAMVGHGWPLFARFRGGRSLMAFVGGMLVVTPVPAAIGVVLLALVSAVGNFALGIRVALFAFPAIQALFDARERVAATGALMSIFVIRTLVARRAGVSGSG
jgi:glycerol-3-phosphate acyltransferase PlsY